MLPVMTGSWMLTPHWVMVGGVAGDGSALLVASRTAHRAELNVEHEVEHIYAAGRWEPRAVTTSSLYRVTVESRDMVMVQASDYVQTHEELLRRWSTP